MKSDVKKDCMFSLGIADELPANSSDIKINITQTIDVMIIAAR